MIANKQLYVVSIIYRDRDRPERLFNTQRPVIATSKDEAEAGAREAADADIADAGWTNWVWCGTGCILIGNHILERVASEVLGVDIRADHDEGSAG